MSKGPLVYHIIEHPHLEGVGLSKEMNWTGRRFPTDDEAAAFAHKDAAGRPYSIKRKRVTRPLKEVNNVQSSPR